MLVWLVWCAEAGAFGIASMKEVAVIFGVAGVSGVAGMVSLGNRDCPRPHLKKPSALNKFTAETHGQNEYIVAT